MPPECETLFEALRRARAGTLSLLDSAFLNQLLASLDGTRSTVTIRLALVAAARNLALHPTSASVLPDVRGSASVKSTRRLLAQLRSLLEYCESLAMVADDAVPPAVTQAEAAPGAAGPSSGVGPYGLLMAACCGTFLAVAVCVAFHVAGRRAARETTNTSRALRVRGGGGDSTVRRASSRSAARPGGEWVWRGG